MRISTQQVFTNAVTQMQTGQTKLAQTQEQIASGKALLRPSDDPVAASQILKLNRELSRVEKFEENIDVSDRRLSQEEIVLDQIDAASVRIKELAIQAGNTQLGDADRGFLADEVRQLQQQILGLMNTKDAQGEYLFSGSQGHTQPFVQNGDGSFSYQGDDGQRFIQVGPEFRIASSDSGRDAFQVIEEDTSASLLGADTSLLSNFAIDDPTADTFKDFTEANGDILVTVTKQTTALDTYELTVTDTAGNVITGDSPAVALQNFTFDSGDGIADTIAFGGLTFDIADLQSISSSALELEVITPTPDPGLISNEQILDADALRDMVDFNGDVTVRVAIGSNLGVPEYSVAAEDADGFDLGVGGVFAGTTAITLDDGGAPATNAISFDVTDPSALTDDQAVSVNISNDPSSFITSATLTDATTQDYSTFAGINGDVEVVFQNNAGVIEYDIQDVLGTSVLTPAGFATLGAGSINVPAMGIDLVVDTAAVAAAIPNPGDDTVGAEVNLGAQVQFTVRGQADVTIRAQQDKHSVLQTAQDLIVALETPVTDNTSRIALTDAVATALDELNVAKEGNLKVRTQLGARLSGLDTAREINADFKLFTDTALSRLQDLDYAEAISEFSLQEMALQASQATFARINQISLFDFL